MLADKKKSKWLTRGAIFFVSLLFMSLIAASFVFFKKISTTPQISLILEIALIFLSLLMLSAFLLVVRMVYKVKAVIEKNVETHTNIAALLDKHHTLLTRVDHNTHLSERAKSIAFREADTHSLREIVFNRLHQKDFESAFEIIDEIEAVAGYKKLADSLRIQANKYKNSNDNERENQVIAHIDKLIDNYQWAQANAQIEKLRWAYPQSEKVVMVTQRLKDKRAERKKILLVGWDSAVQRQDTDRCIEILTELDQYLTSTEGLALQESAKDVFRTKLHNLGVRFSLAVSEQHWPVALDVGQQIIRNFPNSRMSEEISSKLEILAAKVKQQN